MPQYRIIVDLFGVLLIFGIYYILNIVSLYIYILYRLIFCLLKNQFFAWFYKRVPNTNVDCIRVCFFMCYLYISVYSYNVYIPTILFLSIFSKIIFVYCFIFLSTIIIIDILIWHIYCLIYYILYFLHKLQGSDFLHK